MPRSLALQFKTASLALTTMTCLHPIAVAQPPLDESPLPREQWGAPAVEVIEADGVWTIKGKKHVATLTAEDLALRIDAAPVTWQLDASDADDLVVNSGLSGCYRMRGA